MSLIMVESESWEHLEQLAYTAGIIDGEGSISLLRGESRPVQYFGLAVQVGSTTEWLLLWLESEYGGHIYKFNGNRPKSKPAWKWRINGKFALEFLELIVPYLHIKKPQAELAIKFQSRKNLRNNPVMNEADQILMASLNRKGPV